MTDEPSTAPPLGTANATDFPTAGSRAPGPAPIALWKLIFIFCLGVALPAVTLAFELITRGCRDLILDPLPTPVHVALVALVPLTHAAALAPASAKMPRLMRVTSGMVLAVAGVYAVIFLPITPFAVIGILWAGLGLLPLSPLLALIASLVTLNVVRLRSKSENLFGLPPTGVGLALSLLVFALPMLRPAYTHHYLAQAISPDPAVAVPAIATLRRWGERDTLLSSCTPDFGRQEGSPLTLSFLGDSIPRDQAAAAYFRIFGEFCRTDAEELAGNMWGGRRHLISSAEPPEGPKAGSSLQLVSSRIDGTVDTQAAIGYLEWTWTLRNQQSLPAEGSAEVQLPKGAVVSRVTLWVNGEPREAAFAEKHKVQQAYEAVVRRAQDPLLVTAAGPGRIRLRFFPVPAQGTMKFRIGFTSPLYIEDQKHALLAFPHIQQRSFSVDTPHQVWIEAKTPFQLQSWQAIAIKNGFRLDRSLTADDLGRPDAHLTFRLPDPVIETWAKDPSAPNQVVTQRFARVQSLPLSQVVIVLDASRSQGPAFTALSAALSDFPKHIPLAILVAGDTVRHLLPLGPVDAPALTQAAQDLREVKTEGGADSAPALIEALQQGAEHPRTAILWLYGPQPLGLEKFERVEQLVERTGRPQSFYSLRSSPGKNGLLDTLDNAGALQPLDDSRGLEGSLRHLFRVWSGAAEYQPVRLRRSAYEVTLLDSAQTSDHLVRLWANEEIEGLARSQHREAALALAMTHHLVTSVSGAVVLETAEQYKNAALTPGDPGNVPSVPEPEIWVILTAALACVLAYGTIEIRKARKPFAGHG